MRVNCENPGRGELGVEERGNLLGWSWNVLPSCEAVFTRVHQAVSASEGNGFVWLGPNQAGLDSPSLISRSTLTRLMLGFAVVRRFSGSSTLLRGPSSSSALDDPSDALSSARLDDTSDKLGALVPGSFETMLVKLPKLMLGILGKKDENENPELVFEGGGSARVEMVRSSMMGMIGLFEFLVGESAMNSSESSAVCELVKSERVCKGDN